MGVSSCRAGVQELCWVANIVVVAAVVRMNNGGQRKQSNYQLPLGNHPVFALRTRPVSPIPRPMGRGTNAVASRRSNRRLHCCSSSRVPIRRCPRWARSLRVRSGPSGDLPSHVLTRLGFFGSDESGLIDATPRMPAPIPRPPYVLPAPLQQRYTSHSSDIVHPMTYLRRTRHPSLPMARPSSRDKLLEAD